MAVGGRRGGHEAWRRRAERPGDPRWSLAWRINGHPTTNATQVACTLATLARSRIELRAEIESLLQVLDQDSHFGGDPAACGSNGHDWRCALKGSQETKNSAFPEFRGEQPCRRLGNP